MSEIRECAACGQDIVWFKNGAGVVALDRKVASEGKYTVVDGQAYLLALIFESTQSLLSGPRYDNHVLTCKPIKRAPRPT